MGSHNLHSGLACLAGVRSKLAEEIRDKRQSRPDGYRKPEWAAIAHALHFGVRNHRAFLQRRVVTLPQLCFEMQAGIRFFIGLSGLIS
jgi:hypothetical protein